MIYRAIGVMSGSSLDGLDIAFTEFDEQAGNWQFAIRQTDCVPYSSEWRRRLENASHLNARDYCLLDTEFGHLIGSAINDFISRNNLQFQVALISSHGHTVFHSPAQKMTAQLGSGAAIAAETRLPVVSDLRSVDVAFGGQGAPIVPIGEKYLLGNYQYFLNLGGIANLSSRVDDFIAFDVCPANRVLNMLAQHTGASFDADGRLAAQGQVNGQLLQALDALEYYGLDHPKSLANEFGTEAVYPLVMAQEQNVANAMATYVAHIARQVANSLRRIGAGPGKLLITGGGAFNSFLVGRIARELEPLAIELAIPEPNLINYKEAMIMSFMGVLRWRQEDNVLASVTGATKNSINGALWIGQDA
ncbi:MAG TPA: anhydro-N-acetylmuramic acid kinase [Chitinophagaceae bacterium]